MRRRRRRWATGIACLALTLVAGCGGDDEAGGAIGVEIVPASVDGEVPSDGWSLRPETGPSIALRTTGRRGDRGPIFEGQGKDGRYALLGPEPWSLVGGPTLAPMQRDVPPMKLGVGRRYSLYLLPGESASVGAATARWPGVQARGGESVPFERLDGPDRTALRIKPEDWKGTVQVRACTGTTGFAVPMPLDLEPDGTPTGAVLRTGPTLPLDVFVLPPAPAGSPLGADVTWEGLSAHQDATTDASGRAQFPTFPQTGDGVTFRMGSASWTPRLPDASRGDLRLSRPPGAGSAAAPAGTVRLHLPGRRDARPEWQACPLEGSSYGLVADVAPAAAGPSPDDGIVLEAKFEPGLWAFLLSDGERGAVTARVRVVAGERIELTPTLEPLCRVAVSIEGGVARGRSATLECYRIEDGHRVTAQGWVDRFVGRADLEFTLPLGTYRIELSENGRVSSARDVVLDEPSTQTKVRLAPPR